MKTELGLVFAGGVIGTALRAGLGELTGYSTPIVNMLGALVLGVVVGAGMSGRWRTLLGTGLLGSFTTYGTFIAEIRVEMAENAARGILWLGLSLLGGYLLGYLGYWLGSRLRGSAVES